ncbi:hypothetical protein MMC31_003807 [Peltigera leucophlebia]|nr:hypothetical protein [Peltigera leucophlebia]
MPPTIYESFWQSLDGLPPAPIQGAYRTISSSADSTKAIDTPSAWLFQKFTDLTGIARAKLPSSPPKTGTLQDRMPQIEQTHFLNTEADVLRASFLYLLHPVHVAVSELLETGTLDCKGEQTATGGCRTDIRWVYRKGGQTTDIAVLELKNTNVIYWEDFKEAMVAPETAEKKRDSAYGRDNQTFFYGNAYWLSKQAKKYAENVDVEDVAIFDWGVMFIFDFSGMDEDKQYPTIPKGIWFEETSKSSDKGDTFRSLLFGFLIRALTRKNIPLSIQLPAV